MVSDIRYCGDSVDLSMDVVRSGVTMRVSWVGGICMRGFVWRDFVWEKECGQPKVLESKQR